MTNDPDSAGHRPAIDPYLEWALMTRGQYLRSGAKGWWRVAAHSATRLTGPAVPGLAWDTPLSHRPELVTGKLDPSELLDRPDAWQALAGLLLVEPGMRADVVGARPSMPRPDPDPSPSPVPGQQVPTDTSRPVLGIIDGRCGFLNERFLRPGAASAALESRISWYWDQGDEPGRGEYWRAPADMQEGRELGPEQWPRLLSAHGLSQDVPLLHERREREQRAYEALAFDEPADADWSHGTHVLDTVLQEFDIWRATARTDPGEPQVIVVQLPDDALRDTSGRWAAHHVTAGLAYLAARAGNSPHIVANLSLGAFAGPQDGSSLLERSIDAWIREGQGTRSVVVAAGNVGRVTDDGTGAVRDVHERHTIAPDATASWCLDIDLADTTDTFVEFWAPAGAELLAELIDPDGRSSRKVLPGHSARHTGGGRVHAALMHGGDQALPNGQGTLIVLAIGRTSATAGEPAAPAGRWTVQLTNLRGEPAVVDAQVERRDVPGELPGYRPQYGFWRPAGASSVDPGSSPDPASAPGIVGSGSTQLPTSVAPLGSMANGTRTVVVGALSNANEPARYASQGPSRSGRRVDAKTLGQREGAAFFSGRFKSLAGTSVAAARVSAALLANPAGNLPPLQRLDDIRLARATGGPRPAGYWEWVPAMTRDGEDTLAARRSRRSKVPQGLASTSQTARAPKANTAAEAVTTTSPPAPRLKRQRA